jgi:hypothetical protein
MNTKIFLIAFLLLITIFPLIGKSDINYNLSSVNVQSEQDFRIAPPMVTPTLDFNFSTYSVDTLTTVLDKTLACQVVVIDMRNELANFLILQSMLSTTDAKKEKPITDFTRVIQDDMAALKALSLALKNEFTERKLLNDMQFGSYALAAIQAGVGTHASRKFASSMNGDYLSSMFGQITACRNFVFAQIVEIN